MSWSNIASTACPIARSLAIVGDRWTLLVLRELFLKQHRFEDIQAQTGMSPHLLSMRLKRLEKDGIIRRETYNQRPVRHGYRLTEKGKDLYPVLLALKAWGERWDRGSGTREPAVMLIHRQCGHPTGMALACPSCGGHFGLGDVEVKLSPFFTREREERRKAFKARRSPS
ncbi:winged helix-turn-helix transcriptional regulator [Rhodoligotrophos ferricapiens]|uniref:winged helix-turn-helix transcriptional regulator n=1 Tax=Rhodoligotrophos ferricapiens TaxID=3069264 RepID=UPI00315D8207